MDLVILKHAARSLQCSNNKKFCRVKTSVCLCWQDENELSSKQLTDICNFHTNTKVSFSFFRQPVNKQLILSVS